MLPFLRSLPASCALFALVLGLLVLPPSANATVTVYALSNHPDGFAAEPFYGLRLDGLRGDEDEIFTFSFDDKDASVTLSYDDNDTAATTDDIIRIEGIVVGGLDVGEEYDSNVFGSWELEFEYTTNISADGSSLEVTAESPSNAGSITPLFPFEGGMEAIPLVDEQGEHSFSFRFNDVEDHRLEDFPNLSGVFVGWGWLNHSGEPHVKASDWLFTGTVIPEPGTAVLVSLGLFGLTFVGRPRG